MEKPVCLPRGPRAIPAYLTDRGVGILGALTRSDIDGLNGGEQPDSGDINTVLH